MDGPHNQPKQQKQPPTTKQKDITPDVDAISDDVCKMKIRDDLYQDPPPKEECPICMLPIPYSGVRCGIRTAYMPCCGKVLCLGCMKISEENINKGKLKNLCAFCRMPMAHTKKEIVRRCERRMTLGDKEAYFSLGCDYSNAKNGLQRDMNKALELWNQSAELGSVRAHYELARVYLRGESEGVDKDGKKAVYHMMHAAIGGHELARFTLGCQIINNKRSAMRHFMISARAGDKQSLNRVGEGYKSGHVTKDEYAKSLRATKNLGMK